MIEVFEGIQNRLPAVADFALMVCQYDGYVILLCYTRCLLDKLHTPSGTLTDIRMKDRRCEK